MSEIEQANKVMLDSLFEAFSAVATSNYVYVCDMKSDLSRWDKDSVAYFSLPDEYMYNAGEIWASYIHPDDRKEFLNDVQRLFSGEKSSHNLQYRVRNNLDKYVVCTCKGVVLKSETGEPLYFCGAITNHGLESRTDFLTGLKNQYGFFLDINSILSSHTPSYVIMLGFTKFSHINNVYGYTFGNRVLQHVARLFQRIIEPVGQVYRLDGCRFAVITQSWNFDQIYRSYKHIHDRMQSYTVNGTKFNLSLCGSAMKINYFNLTNKTIYSCLNYSYSLSKSQRHGELVLFNDNLDDTDRDKLIKINTIRNAVSDNCKGFFLKYQPIFDSKTEKVVGAEALIRWRNPRFGEISPAEFIPVLENDNLFPILGMWILREAMIDAKKIIAENPNFFVSVNIAYSQCEQSNFVHDVIQLVESIGFPPQNLCLEITERCRLLDMSMLSRIARSFQSKGIKIALDDFGTGFSSLWVVRNISFDTIKIDKAFILDICESNKSEMLVKSVIDIAAACGASVCIEGIETEEMRDKVRNYDVKRLQGFYYSKPIEIDDMKSTYFTKD